MADIAEPDASANAGRSSRFQSDTLGPAWLRFPFAKEMRTHDLKDGEGRVFAFEVDNCFLGRGGLCRLVARIPGCVVVRRPRRFRFAEDEFCEFELDGVRFLAWEPFGDNSRYWVGPKSDGTTPPKWYPQIDRVRAAFRASRPVIGMLFGEPDTAANTALPGRFV